MESADITRTWHDLYVMLGTSAAALIGLFFIATSLHIAEVVSNPVFRARAYNGTLYLLTLLIQAVLILVPQPIHLLGVELCIVNLAGLSLPFSNAYRYFYRNTDIGRHGGLMIYRAVAYGASYLVGLAGAITLIEGFDWGMYLVTASYATLLVAVVLGAWAIMLGVGQSEKTKG
jgi:hypothetical protein